MVSKTEKLVGLILTLELLLTSVVIANSSVSSGFTNWANPQQTDCTVGIGLEQSTCKIMQLLLNLGPMFAIIALLLAGCIYVYANLFVTSDQRGKYHHLAINLAIAALILAALVGGAGLLAQGGTQIFVGSSV